jgi:hypothetical protein
MIIYSPYIDSTIPAFTKTAILVPFYMNPAVGFNEIKRARITVKDYSTSTTKATITYTKTDTNCTYNTNTHSGVMSFNISHLTNTFSLG